MPNPTQSTLASAIPASQFGVAASDSYMLPPWAFSEKSVACDPGNPAQKNPFFFRDLGTCVFCGIDLTLVAEETHIDHLVPECYFKARAGENQTSTGNKPSATGNYEGNLVTSCRQCNKAKDNWPFGGEMAMSKPTEVLSLSKRDYIARARSAIAEKLKETHGSLWYRNALVRCRRVFAPHAHCADFVPPESTWPKISKAPEPKET